MKCKHCGREIGNKKFCGYCGKKNTGTNKLIVASILVSAVTILAFVMICWISPKVTADMFKINIKSLFCEHEWIDATCSHPKTCCLCGKEDGVQLAHSWKPADCTAPVTCRLCGDEHGQPVDHKWTEASCTVPKTCVWCSKTEGEALGHKWKEATHDTPKRCATCGFRPGVRILSWTDIDEDGGEEVFVDDWNIYPSILGETISCAELTLGFHAETADEEPMEGLFRLYVKKPSGKWVYVTDIDVKKEVEEYEILFGYDAPMTFSEYHVFPPKSYSGKYNAYQKILEAIIIE